MNTITIAALGTHWWIEVFDDISTERRDGISDSITTLLSSIENRFSRFRDDSLVGTLNRERTIVTTEPDLKVLIGYGRDMYRKTKGAFNILVGDALVARGYDSNYSLVAQERAVEIGNPLIDIDSLDNTWHLSVGLLDLGGIGKGWAIDQIAELLRNEGIVEFLINGGGDMYGTSEHGKPITIYLEHPTLKDIYLGTTTIHNQGFAASSPHKRRWKTSQGEMGHIIGEVPNIDASFVIADDAVTADMHATTALLLPLAEFTELALAEGVQHALFSATTGRFLTTQGFPFNPLE
jgi:thiamine biosynthesis lipoprotein